MNILITTPHIGRVGGIASYYEALQPHLPDHVRCLPMGRPHDRESLIAQLRRVVRDRKAFSRAVEDCGVAVVSTTLRPKALIRDGILVKPARQKGKRVVVYFFGWDKTYEREIKKRWLWLFRRLFFQADTAIVLSEDAKQQLRHMGYTGEIVVEDTVVDEFLLESPVSQRCAKGSVDSLRLLFLSRIEKRKGIYEFLKTVQILRSRGYRVSAVLAGDGAERQRAEQWACRNRLVNVAFIGYVRGEQKIRAFRDADVFLLPTTSGEGKPLSIFEAMATGLPVITRSVGGVVDFFEHQKMGFMTRSDEPEVFADYVETLIASPDQWQTIQHYNQEYARQWYKASDAAGRLCELCRRFEKQQESSLD